MPNAVAQHLIRAEIGFVGHLVAVANPVAEIDVLKPKRFRLFNLPHDAERAKATFKRRLVEGVDSRESVAQHVNQTHHHELTAFVTKLHQQRFNVTLQQKMLVLLPTVAVHAAAMVTQPLVFEVQLIVLGAIFERQKVDSQLVAMALPSALLAACGGKGG